MPNYWTADTDKQLSLYNTAKTQEERDSIYAASLHYPCSKIVENVLNRFKNVGYCDTESLRDDALGFLVKQLRYFNPEKGSGFTLATITVKRYLMMQNQSGYKRHLTNTELNDEMLDVPSGSSVLDDEFFTGFRLWWDKHLTNVFSNFRSQAVARLIIDGMFSTDNLRKNDFYRWVRSQCKDHSPVVGRTITRMKPYVSGLIQNYIQTGKIEYNGMGIDE